MFPSAGHFSPQSDSSFCVSVCICEVSSADGYYRRRLFQHVPLFTRSFEVSSLSLFCLLSSLPPFFLPLHPFAPWSSVKQLTQERLFCYSLEGGLSEQAVGSRGQSSVSPLLTDVKIRVTADDKCFNTHARSQSCLNTKTNAFPTPSSICCAGSQRKVSKLWNVTTEGAAV